MKIAFVSDSIYPYNKGGKETRLHDLSTKLSELGHDVHIYTMKFWEGEDVILKKGISLHGICKSIPLYKKNRRSIKQGISFGWGCFKLLKEDFDIIDADHMVYFHLFPAKLASLIKKKPLVITWHEVWGKEYWKKYLGKKGIIGYWIEKISSKLPNKIISISNHTTNNLINSLNVPKNKIYTIPNGVNLNTIRKVKPSKEKSDIIFAGRLISHKNLDVLIKSVKVLTKTKPKIKCTIVGDGPEMNNLKDLVKKLKLEKNINFTGSLKNLNEVYSLIKSSKAFVLPSSREGFGIVVIEANALGIPVITVNEKDNASKDLIKEGKNGLVCELTEKDIADAILKVMGSSNKMEKNCMSSVKKYDWDKIIKKFEEVYK